MLIDGLQVKKKMNNCRVVERFRGTGVALTVLCINRLLDLSYSNHLPLTWHSAMHNRKNSMFFP